MDNNLNSSNKNQFKRQVAYKISIKEVLNYPFVKREGFEPSYILTDSGKEISRVNIMGVIVSQDLREIILDDGSENITLRSFEDHDWDCDIGDNVIIIGKIREYNEERYISPEIIKQIKDKGWIDVRKKEIGFNNIILDNKTIIKGNNNLNNSVDFKENEKNEEKKVVNNINKDIKNNKYNNSNNNKDSNSIENISGAVVEEEISESPADRVFAFIKLNDGGEGVDIEKIVEDSNEKNAEAIIVSLLKEGEIFEKSPGRVKVLE